MIGLEIANIIHSMHYIYIFSMIMVTIVHIKDRRVWIKKYCSVLFEV